MFALILLTNFVAAIAVTMDTTVTTKVSVKHKMVASSPGGHSALTNQLHDYLFYLESCVENVS